MVKYKATDLDKSARRACNELLQVHQDLSAQNQAPERKREFLLSAQQRMELITVLGAMHVPDGWDMAPVIQELANLPELEDYCLIPTADAPEPEETCHTNQT